MWKGRFQQETAAAVQRFTESISFDWRLYKFDIQGSIAHASALERAGLLAPEERQQIESGLKAIEQEIDDGRFPFQIDLEDVHMNIESALTARIGPAGGKLHTARSRNDQVALDLRLYSGPCSGSPENTGRQFCPDTPIFSAPSRSFLHITCWPTSKCWREIAHAWSTV